MDREKSSCEVLVVPAMDQSVGEGDQKLELRDQLCYGTMDSMAVSRTTAEESRGLCWRHTIWQTVKGYPYGSRASRIEGSGQSAEETKDEKLAKHLGVGRLNG